MIGSLFALAAGRRLGRPAGVTSVCSAHPMVIRAALRRGRAAGTPALIEATCNQVNQDGGYTGMTPAGFRDFVHAIAAEEGVGADGLILGGDHLGPNPWRHLDAETALGKAEAMVASYVAAGFTKIHLDASMGCAGEPEALDDATTARRAARLARAAEDAATAARKPPPAYVIGTEIPTPGGARHALDHVTPTAPAAALETIATHRRVFAEQGLNGVFDRVLALVVQPGVEFDHDSVAAYRPDAAAALSRVLDAEPRLVFEAHSTDYQPPARLAELVRDGFAILKVGPALTFALREALYGLDLIAGELDPAYGVRPLAQAMERLMTAEPNHWQAYYRGSEDERRLLRHYSYSDRIRYYWTHPAAHQAVGRLMAALGSRPISEALASQFLPRLGEAGGNAKAADLLVAAVDRVLADYAAACAPGR